MTAAPVTRLGAGAVFTESPTVVQVVWRPRADVRRQTGHSTPARARRFSAPADAKRFIAENYAKLQQLAVANTRELTGRDRF